MTEIDPFTFFGVFNRGIRTEQRIEILRAIKERFVVCRVFERMQAGRCGAALARVSTGAWREST